MEDKTDIMHVALVRGSGYVDVDSLGKRWVFRPRRTYAVDASFGMYLLKSTDGRFAIATPDEDSDKEARRAKASALIDRLAGLDTDTLDKYNALLDAAVSQKAAEVVPKKKAPARKSPAKKAPPKKASAAKQ